MPLFVFDLDGTLVDSLGDLTGAANDLLARHGRRPLRDEEVAAMIGEGVGTLVRRVLAARQLTLRRAEAVSEFLASYDGRLLERTRPYEGIPEALAELQRSASLAVLTNKPAAASERILDGLALRSYFRWVVGGDGPDGRKPDPRGLQALMDAAGCLPSETVMVGDSRIDVDTARAAGVRACLARYGFGFWSRPPDPPSGDDLVVDHPAALPRVLLGSVLRS